MKVALFIIDNPTIKGQINKLLKSSDILGLKVEDFVVINKQAKKLKYPPKSKSIFQRLKNIDLRESIESRINKYKEKNTKEKLACDEYIIDSINSKETMKLLNDLAVDIGIFIIYDEIVKKDILELIKLPINIHPAHLPEFRGCQPIYWLLAEKQDISAITFHKMTEGIDEGDIIFEYPFYIRHDKSFTYNHNAIINNISKVLLFGLRRIVMFKGDFSIKQNEFKGKATYYGRPKI